MNFMQKFKRIGLYGVSGTGKTTILKEVVKKVNKVIWLEGSKLISEAADMSLDEFKKLPFNEKYFFREKAIERAWEIQKEKKQHIIIDGHLLFAKGESEFENVMTEKDADFYTEYIYLKLPAQVVMERIQNDKKRNRDYSLTTIYRWAEAELKQLSAFCSERNIPLTVLSTEDLRESVNFLCDYINKEND